MSLLKTIFFTSHKILDVASICIHGGMLINTIGLGGFFKKQIDNVLKPQIDTLQNGKALVKFLEELAWARLSIEKQTGAFFPDFTTKNLVNSGIMGLTEQYIIGTHFSLAYPIASLLDYDGDLHNSSEFLYSFGAIGIIELGHYLTSDSEESPEHE